MTSAALLLSDVRQTLTANRKARLYSCAMALVDLVADRIAEVVKEGRSRIAVSALFRVSCEGWLKIELLKSLWESFGDSETNEILPESDHFDLVVKADTQVVRIELKTFPTNYGLGGKP